MINSRSKLSLQVLVSTAMVVIAFSTSSLPAHAASPDVEEGTIQPFACGPSTADVVNESPGLGSTGKAIKLVSKAGADCGLVLSDLPEKYYLIDSGFLENSDNPRVFNALRIDVRSDDIPSVKDAVIIRMCFKPQFGSPDLISVDVPLKDFRQENRNTYWATRTTIFGNRPGVTDLRKLSVILTKSGSATVYKLRWAAEINPTFRRAFVPKTILLQNADCAAGRPCRPPIAEILNSKIAPLLEMRQSRPTRPSRTDR